MKNIEVIAKWSLKRNCWEDPNSFVMGQKSLAIASFPDIVNSENSGFDYIIIADGTRLENHSKDGKQIKTTGVVKNVIDYFERKNGNFRFKLILLDNDAPLVEESRYIASYLDSLLEQEDVRSISYIGISKCGVMAFDLMKYLKSSKAKEKLRVYSLSSPYQGTLLASPIYFECELKKMIAAKIESKTLQRLIYEKCMAFFRSISSNSHMDYDIALPGGAKELYDPSFIADIFSPTNVAAIDKVADFQNICTVIDENVRREVIRKRNFLGIGLCLLDTCLYHGGSDGLVLLTSQSKIEEYYKPSVTIKSFHNPLEAKFYASQVLDMVWDGIMQKGIAMKRIKKSI